MQYPNLPFYNPEDDDPNRPLPFMIQLDRRRHARATILPSTPTASTPAAVTTPVEQPQTPSPEPLDGDDYEDEEEENPTPWDPCAYEEPVSYDPAYYELLNNQ